MTYVREVSVTDFYNCMWLYFQFDSFCVFSEFKPVSLISKYSNAFKAHILLLHIFLTHYSNAGAAALHISPTFPKMCGNHDIFVSSQN